MAKGKDTYTLLIVESPAKAKTINKYLGNEYKVVASVGHIRDLPKSNKAAIDIEAGFVPKYVVSPGKEKVIREIADLAKNASQVYLASDRDREGEAIAWHVNDSVHLKNAKRIVFNEITKEAIEEALKHPRDIDANLVKAQEARRVLDRLVGYDLSGLIWKKVRYGLSAGRVQSPALRIIMEREREIRSFVPEQYFVLEADLTTGKKQSFTATCTKEPKTKDEAERIVSEAKKHDWTVVSVDESNVKRSPRPPFITSTLQQTASTRFGFSPSRTMGIAQKLYEAGHITYMRTDSVNLSKGAIAESLSVIEKEYGKDFGQARGYASRSKNAQEAHEAIRPSHVSVPVAGSNEDEKKLYHLIRARTLASQMKDAELLRTKITTNISGSKEGIPDFTVTGSRVQFEGWLKADPDARGEDVELPEVKAGDSLTLSDIRNIEKWTEPPGRYTEAGLVKELEKRDIGRPSTYASIIRTLEEREYVNKVNKALVPTDTGDVVSTFLEQNFASYISDDFTAEMENKLDKIADGSVEYVKTLKDFYIPFSKEVKEKDKLDKATNLGEADAKFTCPTCGSGMIIKLGRGGKFLSCERYPDCTGALTINGEEIKGDTPIGYDPKTKLPIFVKTGKYGPYVQLGDADSLLKYVTENPVAEEAPAEAPKKKTRAKKPKAPKPRMSSIPKGKDLSSVTLEDALRYLSIPRQLGEHPETGKVITANVGRFGPYIVHDGDFRSLKGADNPYDITYERAVEILKEPKKVSTRGRWAKKKKEE
ncbi:MAG: type I DNA topoisomerase [Candidatus Taylorbacteria bacterium]|nr:type I DNA topoisomerase [Candidatus Taylorbacteria bacterium]